MYSKSATRENDQSVYQWTLKSFLIGLFALLIGGRIHCLPSGKLVIIFKWQYFATTLLAVCFGTLAILNTSFQWSHMDPNDEQSTFVPITARKVSFKWRKYITNEPLAHPPHHPKIYYPPNCPHSQHYKSCAKPVPSFIFAGSELAGASFVFRLFRQHPQIVASVDNSDQLKARHIFDKEGELDEATAFESYISQFPFLQDHVLNTVEKNNWIAGENAPHYLYKSHLTAKRIKDNLPHAKLVFFLRDPISRAYSQYLQEASNSHHRLPFEKLVDLELPILQHCGHTTTQSGWEGFVRCHQGSEIRASWRALNDSHSFNSLAKGMYYPALLPFLKHFPPCQIFIARTEDILVNPSSLFQKLATFLDIDPSFFSERNAYPQDEWTEEEIVAKQVDIPIPTTPTATPTTHTIHDRNSLSLQRSRHSNRFLPNPERIEPQHQHSLKTDQLPLSIRYRLERIFGLINDKLLELIDIEKTHFGTWEYDVERG